MKKKILLGGTLITFIAVFASMCIVVFSQHKENVNGINRHMNLILTNLSQEMNDTYRENRSKGLESFDIKEDIKKIENVQRFEDQYRFTWIDKDGKVLYDSSADESKMENHSQREEFIEAMRDKKGASKRYSKTLSREYRYRAYKTAGSTVIRVSTDIVSPFRQLLESLPMVVFITLIATFITMIVLSRILKSSFKDVEKVARNINDEIRNDSEIEYYEVDEELLPLVKIINKQKEEISYYVKNLEDRITVTNEILDNMNEGLIMLDQNDNILVANGAAIKLLDVPNNKHIDSHIISLVRDREFIDAVRSNEKNTVLLNKNEKYLNIFISPLVDSEDIVSGKIVFILDNTTNYIEEKYRREFSANISHELKTPLTSINGYAEMIAAGLADEDDIRAFANTILKQGRKLLELIDDIIKLSKLDEKASVSIEKKELDVDSVANSVIKMLEPMASEKNINISYQSKGKLMFKSVESMLEEILYNLMVNSIDYNVDGGKIFLDIEDLRDQIKITVRDTGIGISKEDLPRIFERFYMVDKSRNKTNTNSTGLGLAIVKHIVIMLGGTIEAKSKLGEGTSMEILLNKD
ncbi:two-component system, OmpR family, phosphate regulon sensor histidine kinase PhoR [Peptostreptococcus russellii]|uniref:histidine kinase n=1 Tax=Peptostreptococcus russellii TaxID=215200 RepID=A0A1H8K1J1_9FIRM|nr:ATP-binding protein [Peptostreptococcus russellii]SEN86416.1 two-component system, OmpR family, phosphate regulon sensor histidine kinase PhoR [Peptostreptococcus russellii]